MFSFFFRSRSQSLPPLFADMHSHLIPGIDDGVKTNEESFAVIDELIAMGYEKLITTPHIMSDYYPNTAESIEAASREFLTSLRAGGYSIPFHCAAEYYLDEHVMEAAASKEPFLTFGDRYFLFETNAISEPLQLKEFIFTMTSKGMKPVLAHPERYQYMNLAKAEDLRHRGVLLQVNILSLIGYYGPPVQHLAEKLVKKGWVDMLGTDCHNLSQIGLLNKARETKIYRTAVGLPLLNHSL